MGLGEIYSKSWKELGNNFWLIFKLTFYFIIIPVLIFTVLFGLLALPLLNATIHSFNNDPLSENYIDIGSTSGKIITGFLSITGNAIKNAANSQLDVSPAELSSMFGLIVLNIIFIFIFIIIYLIFSSTVVYLSAYNEKGEMKLKEALKNQFKYFWKIVGFMIIFAFIFLVILFIFEFIVSALLSIVIPEFIAFIVSSVIAFIILIYLQVKLAFTMFFIVKDNFSISKSLAESSKLVKGRWWKTFGYILLFSLTVSIPIGIFGFISWIISILLMLIIVSLFSVYPVLIVIIGIISYIIYLVLYSFLIAIMGSFITFLLKNLYLEYINENKESK